MKKITFLIIAFSLTTFALISCTKKDSDKTYTCQCLDKTTKIGTEDFQVSASSESDAQSECDNEEKSNENCYVSY